MPGLARPSGALALDGFRSEGRTRVLPSGPTRTAFFRALPFHSSFHERNHAVQPSSHLPRLGLPVTVEDSSRSAQS